LFLRRFRESDVEAFARYWSGELVTEDFVAAMQQSPTLISGMGAVKADANYDFDVEFDAGLDLVLDGIARWRDVGNPAPG